MAIATMRVPTLFTAIDKYSDVVSKMTRKTALFGETAQGVALRTSKKLSDFGNSALIAGGSMAAGLGYAINESSKFEKSITNINSLLLLPPEQIKKFSDEVLKMSSNTATPLDELTTSLYDLISAGVKVEDSLKFLGSSDILSRTGLGTLPEATDAMLASMRNFKDDYKDTNDAANVLFKTVKYGKLTLSKLSEAYTKNAVAASLAGFKGQEFNAMIAGMSITTMPIAEIENMLGGLSIALNKGKGKLPEIFKEQGVKNAKELLKKSGSIKNMLDRIAISAKKLGLNVNQIFPLKGASTAFALLTKNKQVIDKTNESLNSMYNKSEDAIGAADKLMKNTTAYKFGELKNNVKILSIAIGEALLPIVKKWVDILKPGVKKTAEFAKEHTGLSKTVFYTASGLLAVGVGAKVASGFMYGYAKVLQFVNWTSKTLGIKSVATGLGEVAIGAGLTASAIALMGIAIYKINEDYKWLKNHPGEALHSVRAEWRTTTFTIENEINKQKKLIAEMQNPITKNGYDPNKLYNLNPNGGIPIEQQKLDYLSKFKNKPLKEQQQAMLRWNQDHIAKGTTFRLPTDSEYSGSPSNLAGSSGITRQDIMSILNSKSGDLNVNIKTDSGASASVEGEVPKGINPVLTPNQGARGRNWWE